MITDELSFRITQELGLTPTVEQQMAVDVFCRFLAERDSRAVMVLRGSAGTGKTTLASAMVRSMVKLGQKVVLLAPTGRAAKVFALNSGRPAYTIHRRIYRQRTAGDMSSFNLNYNNATDTLYMVDEASMIANGGHADSVFADGRLLDDLVSFVYSGRNCRMVLIGDRAQLPPVGESESPALSGAKLRAMGLCVYECDLNEVVRQSLESGILWNATRIRQMGNEQWTSVETGSASVQPMPMSLPKIRFWGFADIQIVPGNELIEQLNSSYSQVGIDDTIVVTRSNKRAGIYNQGIRNTILDREEELCRGDLLMVVKNNYHWTQASSTGNAADGATSAPTFLANGDRARVHRVRHIHELYDFRFAEVTLVFPDFNDYELEATVLLDTLTAEAPALTREQQELLYNNVMDDYADIPQKGERIRELRRDAHYNALQVKFAYAVTCHKAQGGQWAHVYVDQGYMTDDMLTPDYIHWLYTAFTRASEKLYLVNWPKTQVDGNVDE
ncbi:MAG: AAA family ATPase [Prevotella sp.]|nr:AAA family ATPase [Prevotella sp.]